MKIALISDGGTYLSQELHFYPKKIKHLLIMLIEMSSSG